MNLYITMVGYDDTVLNHSKPSVVTCLCAPAVVVSYQTIITRVAEKACQPGAHKG